MSIGDPAERCSFTVEQDTGEVNTLRAKKTCVNCESKQNKPHESIEICSWLYYKKFCYDFVLILALCLRNFD